MEAIETSEHDSLPALLQTLSFQISTLELGLPAPEGTELVVFPESCRAVSDPLSDTPPYD